MEERYPRRVHGFSIFAPGAISFFRSDDAEAFGSVFRSDGEKTDFRDFVPIFWEIHVYSLGHIRLALPIEPRSGILESVFGVIGEKLGGRRSGMPRIRH